MTRRPDPQRKRLRLSALAGSLVLLVATVTPIALADVEPPPVTVPTPTVPAPVPDPAPAPTPAPQPKPHASRPGPASPPSQGASSPRPSSTPRVTQTQKQQPFAGTSKRAKKHKSKKHRATKVTASKKDAGTPPASVSRTSIHSPKPTDWLKWGLLLVLGSIMMATSLIVATRNRGLGSAMRGYRGAARPMGASPGRRQRLRGRVREVVPDEVLPRELARRQPIPLPAASSDRNTEELPAALGARVEAATAAVAPIPVATAEVQTVPRTAVPATVRPAENEALDIATDEFCEIAVWHGYAKSRFYARLDVPVSPDEAAFAVAESHPFRFRGNGIPDRTEASEAAYDALVKKLVAKGWEFDASGDGWYASRFRRPLTHA
jgi:hypothetical protein